MVTNLKVEPVEVECSQLRKDLIVAMNERNEAHKKIKELTEALHVEKTLVVQKDEEIQVSFLKTDTKRDKVVQKFKQPDDFSDLQFIQYFKGFELLRWSTMKHHSLAMDFSNLDFEKIDTEILADEAKEQEENEADAMEKDTTEGKDTNESAVPPSQFSFLFLSIWKTMVTPLCWGFIF